MTSLMSPRTCLRWKQRSVGPASANTQKLQTCDLPGRISEGHLLWKKNQRFVSNKINYFSTIQDVVAIYSLCIRGFGYLRSLKYLKTAKNVGETSVFTIIQTQKRGLGIQSLTVSKNVTTRTAREICLFPSAQFVRSFKPIKFEFNATIFSTVCEEFRLAKQGKYHSTVNLPPNWFLIGRWLHKQIFSYQQAQLAYWEVDGT